jgi:DNA topoisomerase I
LIVSGGALFSEIFGILPDFGLDINYGLPHNCRVYNPGGAMSEKVLVIVESPTKARTIKKFLPKEFDVEASIGHVRDLPQSASDIPKNLKQESWARLGINVEENFKPLYITPRGKSKIITELKKKVKTADTVYLATDEDREGESISWHLVEVLKPKTAVKRMVFHEITKTAIQHALDNPREINMQLVKAQETRRILDRLYGYTLSPLIWKKIAYGLSAGRVQSPGLRMIVERERERIRFRKSSYWDLKASLSTGKDEKPSEFEARLISVDGVRIAGGKDFDEKTGALLPNKTVRVLQENDAEALKRSLEAVDWTVRDVVEKETVSRPAPPFITSTLQQEANRKLGLSARESMRVAQKLYEEGLITYMRTDSPHLSGEGIQGARTSIQELFGTEYLAEKPRQYSTRSRDAQEAHEAIRPAGARYIHPEQTGLDGRERALYELIWKRTLATQMAEARKLSMTVKIEAGNCVFQANGTRIVFPGFIRAYVEGKDDPEAALEDREVLLPALSEADTVVPAEVVSVPHETKPPPRYTEASLVQRLEKEGIGRPSTYASIIGTILERGYIRRQGNQLVPTFTGMGVTQLLENHFHDLVKYGFTSDMETALDEIAEGTRDHLQYLEDFYLGEHGLKNWVEHEEVRISPDVSRTIHLPQLSDETEIRIGRYGPYIVHTNDEEPVNASIPEDIAPADLTEEQIEELIEIQKNGPVPIGEDPESGEPIYCLSGRYGPYLQIGEQTEDNPKPKRASVPRGMNPREIDLQTAIRLLSLPRTLGDHPETGKPVVANNGRFGPYVVCDGDYRSLKKDDDVYTITLDRALELLREEKRSRRGSTLVKELGTDPKTEKKKIGVYNGRYGMYIKYGTKNIRLPDDKKTPEAVEALTLEDALKIIRDASK